ncbi:MAG TPA: alpha/beta hydrolase [Bacillota bacterium]|nr:alpha/beta hydrolase [Bacillota bacterium]
MLTETIQLWEDNEAVTLTAYIQQPSEQIANSSGRPAVIVCPGGGYLHLADKEGEPVALRFAAYGYQAFVLRYSTMHQARFPQSLFDLARAITVVRQKAQHWKLDPERIALCGFSAGGHLAGSLGVYWNSDFLKEKFGGNSELLRPNAAILSYPLIDFKLMSMNWFTEVNGEQVNLSQIAVRKFFGTQQPTEEQVAAVNLAGHVSSQTPPTFLWHTAEDQLVPARGSIEFAAALTVHKVPFELHVFQEGDHALGLCDEGTPRHPWFELALSWLNKRFGM